MTKKHFIKTLCTLAVLALGSMATTACVDEESALGVNLVDPATLYDGCRDTLYATDAYSLLDDSLMTTGYSFGIIGNYSDAVYGSVSSVLYSQIALQQASSSVNFRDADNHIDSVVLCLVTDGLFPDSSASYNFHFTVRQLAEPVQTDSLYYSHSSLPVDETATFFNGTVTVGPADTVVRLRLNDNILNVIKDSATAADFILHARGLRIAIEPDSDPGMLGINFAAVKTGLSVFYRYGADTLESEYVFLVGAGATHFTQFVHDYSGTAFASADSVGGAQTLYLEPLAGYRAVVNFDAAVRAFSAAHPRAVIHYAELQLTPSASADANRPGRVIGLHKVGGEDTYINDFLSASGDGTYQTADGRFRLRVTQHMQGLLRGGSDPGTHLVLDARRSSAQRTVIDGLQASNPPRIILVYTE